MVAESTWDLFKIIKVSIFILSVAFSLKYFFSYTFIRSQLKGQASESKLNQISALVSFCLVFCFSLPSVNLISNGNYYLGQVPPNVWHNSTEMLLIPFAIWLFVELNGLISKPTIPRVLVCSGLVAINLMIKPSYFFCIGPLFPLFVLYKYRFSGKFFSGVIPVGLGFILLFIQYYLIFSLNMGSVYKTEKSSVVFSSPFEVWLIFSSPSQIPFLLISSCLFPFMVFVFLTRKRDFFEKFAIYSFIISLLIFIFINESGPRASHGNFIWQVIICNYLLFMVAARNLIFQFFSARTHWFWLSSLVFVLHFTSGIFYIIRFLSIRDYF